MNRISSLISIILLSFCLTAGCTKSSISQGREGLVYLNFDTSIEGPVTKTPGISGTQFPYDHYRCTYSNTSVYYTSYPFSLWICNEGTVYPHMTGFNNMQCEYRAFINNTSSILIPYTNTNGNQETFAKIGKGIDIFSFYPFVACSDPHEVPFKTTDQSDWMWAEPVHLTQEDTESAVGEIVTPLHFHHAMTCIEIWLECWYSTTINLTSITMTDSNGKLVSSGKMDATTGELSEFVYSPSITIKGNNTNPYNPQGSNYIRNVSEDGYYWDKYSFIMPEYDDFDGSNLVLSFVFDTNAPGRNTYTLSNHLKDEGGNTVVINKFETGKRYVYQLRLDNTLLIEPLHQFMPEWTTEEKTFSM